MPDQSWDIASYALASAVAAAAVVWVLRPSLFPFEELDEPLIKGGAVGLHNRANDCFVNSVLQALVGSVQLRRYLLQQSSRSQLADSVDTQPRSLEHGVVTRSLQAVLKHLAESSSRRKTISAAPFIKNLEIAFAARLNRQQQDAHELLQLVLDRLRDEHRAFKANQHSGTNGLSAERSGRDKSDKIDVRVEKAAASPSKDGHVEASFVGNFPCEGQLESQVECQTCGFKPIPQVSSFVVLSLTVPQQRSVSLDDCLNGVFMQEIIEDYICDRCRLSHALESKNLQIASSTGNDRERLHDDAVRLEKAILEDPERSLDDMELPARSSAPKTKISKCTRIKVFPQVLVLHLSRSTFSSVSTKNAASVAFDDILQLGGLRRVQYELVSLITHLGGHDSGHYVACRRQSATDVSQEEEEESAALLADDNGPPAKFLAGERRSHSSSNRSGKNHDKWWCISDERVRACKTQDVLQKRNEAYMFIYERQTPIAMLPQS
ncbi:MAG: hypothetical protein M1831_002668 [Alyxoria varia]|nr:MAG: hypothetical protein M1831_002668 [Alyxoria varia]